MENVTSKIRSGDNDLETFKGIIDSKDTKEKCVMTIQRADPLSRTPTCQTWPVKDSSHQDKASRSQNHMTPHSYITDAPFNHWAVRETP